MYKYFDQQKFDWRIKNTLDQIKLLINKFLSEKYRVENLDSHEGKKLIKLHSSTLNADSIYAHTFYA